MMDGQRYAKHIGAVTDAADDLVIRSGNFCSQRGTQALSQRRGGGMPKIRSGSRETGLGRIQGVFIDDYGAIVQPLTDTGRDPAHIDSVNFASQLEQRLPVSRLQTNHIPGNTIHQVSTDPLW